MYCVLKLLFLFDSLLAKIVTTPKKNNQKDTIKNYVRTYFVVFYRCLKEGT